VIRAWGVDVLTRSAQYNPPIDYSALEVFSEEDKAKQEGDPKSPLAKRGFVHVPSGAAPGGIICHNGIEQDITVNLIALRRLQAGNPEETLMLRREETLMLRRYLLGLSLVAATAPLDGFLRQGCLLVPDANSPASWSLVKRDGSRGPVKQTNSELHELAKIYASSKATAFGVGEPKTVQFSKDDAKKDAAEGGDKSKGGKGKKAEGEPVEGTAAEG